MSDVVRGVGTGPRDRMAFAIVLIVVGAASLALNLLDLNNTTGGLVVMAIGLGCLGAFVYTRHVGYLIPGGIMTGLGAGILASGVLALSSSQGTGGVIVLGLGFGFVSVWVIGALMRLATNHWWPLIPGGILVLVGAVLLIGGEAVNLLEYWGVAVIAVGLLVLWRAWAEGRVRT